MFRLTYNTVAAKTAVEKLQVTRISYLVYMERGRCHFQKTGDNLDKGVSIPCTREKHNLNVEGSH